MMSRCEARGWSAPTSPSFAAHAGVIEVDPFFTPDGKGLYFISARQDLVRAQSGSAREHCCR